MHLLLLGCTGFIGSELVPRLLKAGHHLTIISRRNQKDLQISLGCLSIIYSTIECYLALSSTILFGRNTYQQTKTYSGCRGKLDLLPPEGDYISVELMYFILYVIYHLIYYLLSAIY